MRDATASAGIFRRSRKPARSLHMIRRVSSKSRENQARFVCPLQVPRGSSKTHRGQANDGGSRQATADLRKRRRVLRETRRIVRRPPRVYAESGGFTLDFFDLARGASDRVV